MSDSKQIDEHSFKELCVSPSAHMKCFGDAIIPDIKDFADAYSTVIKCDEGDAYDPVISAHSPDELDEALKFLERYGMDIDKED